MDFTLLNSVQGWGIAFKTLNQKTQKIQQGLSTHSGWMFGKDKHQENIQHKPRKGDQMTGSLFCCVKDEPADDS